VTAAVFPVYSGRVSSTPLKCHLSLVRCHMTEIAHLSYTSVRNATNALERLVACSHGLSIKLDDLSGGLFIGRYELAVAGAGESIHRNQSLMPESLSSA